MTARPSSATIDRQIRTLFSIGAVGAMTDGALLEHFVRGGDAAEPAFASLVERHGPMVLRVCRNLLVDSHLAEDAFQVTFLLLARRASSIHNPDALAGWLHRVARRVAIRARVRTSRRGDREQAQFTEVTVTDGNPVERDELGAIVHQEIERLHNTQRLPILLCALEGLSHEEAARRLGWPVGTIKSRLVRGRRQLEARLTRRGVAPAIVLTAVGGTTEAPAAVPLALAVAATRIAAASAEAANAELTAGALSATVASLLKNELSAIFFTKLKLATGMISAAAIAIGLIGIALGQNSGRSDATAASTPNAPKTQTESDGTASQGEQREDIELRVVGPGGKPIPEAVVELRSDALPTAGQIRQGKFAKQGQYGMFVATDAQGRLAVKLPKAPTHLDVFINTPGYGPYWAGWSSETHAEPIPSRFTAELDAGWSVGGIIVDSEGKPVEGVTIGPGIEFKKRPGDLRQMRSGTKQKTDAAGRWRFDSVPIAMNQVFVEINHPGFAPIRRPLTRAEFGIERGREPVAKVVLNRGLAVTGRVIDEAGKPVVGASVRTKFFNDIREAKTGSDGVFKLAGCEPRMAQIVVSARGRATDMKEVRIDSDMEPVDFQMKPGGTVRIRVLDRQGNPVPRCASSSKIGAVATPTSHSTASINMPTRMESGCGTKHRWMNSRRISALPVGWRWRDSH